MTGIIITLTQLSCNGRVWGKSDLFDIFDFTTAGDWDCVAAVERLPAIHYNVDFIFLSFWVIGFIAELLNY